MAAGLAFIITLPLFMARVLGGGDVKILLALSFSLSVGATMNVIVGSFIWASLIGVIYAIVNGTFKRLASNTVSVLRGQPREKITMHQVPFTVTLLLAWLTHLTLEKTGGSLW